MHLLEVLNDFGEACLFVAYLKSRLLESYLEFWLQVEEYKQLPDDLRESRGKALYHEFFTDKSPKFLNMEEIFTEGLDKSVSRNEKTLFNITQAAAWKILQQAYSTYPKQKKDG